jgi:hypothetical protein
VLAVGFGFFLLGRPRTRYALAVFGLFLVLLPLARPEGLPLALVFAGFHLWDTRERLPLATRLIPITILLSCGLVYGIWHLHTFGHLAPNTYYAKTSDIRWNEITDGFDYVLAATDAWPQLILLAVIGLGWTPLLAGKWTDRDGRALYGLIWLSALVSLSVVVYSGGDCYRGTRFLAVPFILATVALVVAQRVLSIGWGRIALGIMAMVAALQSVAVVENLPQKIEALGRWPLSRERFDCTRQIMDRFKEALPSATMAQSDFQRAKFFAGEMRVVDLHGLSDKTIAHKEWPRPAVFGKYHPAHAIEVDADIWVWGFKFMAARKPMAAVPMSRLIYDARTQRLYTGYRRKNDWSVDKEADNILATYLPATSKLCGRYFNFLIRKDRAAALAASPYFVVGRSE